MSSIIRNIIILFILAIAVRIFFHFTTGFITDDAFITFRYVSNFLDGNGFVYNIGEKVLGTTSPFYAFVLIFFGLLNVPEITASLIISMICAGFTSLFIYRIAIYLRFRIWAIVPSIVYIFWSRSIVADSSGMETALFTCLLTGTFYYRLHNQKIYAFALATLAALTRPEGGIMLLLLLIEIFLNDRKSFYKMLSIPLVLFIPYVIFTIYYFGSPIPNSIQAKLALYSQFGTDPIVSRIVQFFGLHSFFGWLLLLTAFIGATWLNKKQNFGRFEIIWVILFSSFFIFSSTRLFFWYIPPIYPILFIFATALLVRTDDFLQTHKRVLWEKRINHIKYAVITLIILGSSFSIYGNAIYYKNYHRTLLRVHRQAGFYLFANSDKKATVAAEDIGYLGYYSKRRILDRDGLVSPSVIRYNEKGQYGEVIKAFQPDYLCAFSQSEISGFLNDSTVMSNYKLEKVFDSSLISEYRIYSRKL